MANLEYVDFDNSLLDEIATGAFLENVAVNDKSRLHEIANEHRRKNPWRNHLNFADLVHKRLRVLCKEGRIHHDGSAWQTCPA
jgi:hypothetical protein